VDAAGDSYAFRPGRLADVETIAGMLRAAHLPANNVEDFIDGFVIAERDGEIAGCGGLELYDASAMLRSVVVAEVARGTGLGRAIAQLLEQKAIEAGAKQLYLFSIENWTFWQHLGYEDVPLEDWVEPAKVSWQHRYVSAHQDEFRAMGLHSMKKSVSPAAPPAANADTSVASIGREGEAS
jgi:amino-acid N-acetyltransferase